MKKIIGILGVAMIAATIFFSTNWVSGSTADTNLASLIRVNSANAETDGDGGDGFFKTQVPVSCTRTVPSGVSSDPAYVYPDMQVPGTKIYCMGIGFGCISTHCI